jgi:hypothetical protein
MPFGIKKP